MARRMSKSDSGVTRGSVSGSLRGLRSEEAVFQSLEHEGADMETVNEAWNGDWAPNYQAKIMEWCSGTPGRT